MFEFALPWALAALPLPFIAHFVLPPYRESSMAVRIPFFEQLAAASGQTPRRGAVLLGTTWLQRLVAVMCWTLVVAALARPQLVQPPIERTQPARDLLLAIDLSQSMDTADFPDPQGRKITRLAAVRQVVAAFIERRTTDRIGLIVFGTSAFPYAPPSLDHKTLEQLLDEARSGMAGPQTAIGDAIGQAIKMTEASQSEDKVLVLLTDGNDTASRVPPETAAELARSRDLTIHTIGIGDPAAAGESKVDLAMLQRIAATTGGRFFRGEDQTQLAAIYQALDALTPVKVKHLVYRPRVDLFWIPLGTAAVVAALYHLLAMLSSYPVRRGAGRQAAAGAAARAGR